MSIYRNTHCLRFTLDTIIPPRLLYMHKRIYEKPDYCWVLLVCSMQNKSSMIEIVHGRRRRWDAACMLLGRLDVQEPFSTRPQSLIMKDLEDDSFRLICSALINWMSWGVRPENGNGDVFHRPILYRYLHSQAFTLYF